MRLKADPILLGRYRVLATLRAGLETMKGTSPDWAARLSAAEGLVEYLQKRQSRTGRESATQSGAGEVIPWPGSMRAPRPTLIGKAGELAEQQ